MHSSSQSPIWDHIFEWLKRRLHRYTSLIHHLLEHLSQHRTQILVSLKEWPSILPHKVAFSRPPALRNLFSCCGPHRCRDCTSIHNPEKFDRPLWVCRPYLWTMDISHLVMMLQMRISSLKDQKSDAEDGGLPLTGLPLEKIDEVIRKDIEAVMVHRKITLDDLEELPWFVGRLEKAKKRLQGFEEARVVEVIEKLGACKAEKGWGIFQSDVDARS